MRNYKFKLSDMMPNAWFYKLKDMSKAKKQSKHSNSNKKPHISQPRRSIYHNVEPIEEFYNSPKNPKFFDTQFPDFPRKSSNRRSRRRKTVYKPSPRLTTSSVRARNNCHFSSSESSGDDFYEESPLSESENNSIDARVFDEFSSWSSSCTCRVTSSTTDIFIDVNEKKSSVGKKIEKFHGFDSFSDIHLRPILTKSSDTRDKNARFTHSRQKQSTLSVKIVKEDTIKAQNHRKKSISSRKSLSKSPGLKLKSNSPKLSNKKIRPCSRKSVYSKSDQRKSFSSKSFAIVKSSFDPLRDFRDSMVEMILENDISASEDLEELLACYLSLNLEEYHDIIVKAFEQIWFEMANLKL